MAPFRFERERIPFYLTFAAAVSPLISGAVCNILIGLALASMIALRVRPKLPRAILAPLGAFFVLTLIATLASADPWLGRTGIRKFYLVLVAMLIYTTFRKLSEVRLLLYAWTAVMTASAIWSLVQFAGKYQAAAESGQNFYQFYTGERITGFMSHWMTLGGQEMNVVLLAAALWFFGADTLLRGRWIIPAAAAVILTSLVAGFTRSIWLGTAIAGLYLIWNWKRWAVLVTPVPVALLLIANPADVRERAISAFQPHGDTDSNQFRVVCRRTGAEMIKAHPWFGLGPEQPRIQFLQYLPADVPRPLPTGWYGHLHNLYYHYAAERGLPALAVFLWWIARMLWDFARALRSPAATPLARAILHGAIASILGILLTGLYEVNLGDGEILAMFSITFGCGYLAVSLASASDPAEAAS